VVGGTLGNLPEPRERALAQLMRDLAGLRIPVSVAAVRLIAREHARGVAGDGGAEPADLERRERRVAAEERREPRNAAGEVMLPAMQRRTQEPQIEETSPHDALEHRVAAHLGATVQPLLAFPFALAQHCVHVAGAAAAGRARRSEARRDLDGELASFPRFEIEVEPRSLAGE